MYKCINPLRSHERKRPNPRKEIPKIDLEDENGRHSGCVHVEIGLASRRYGFANRGLHGCESLISIFPPKKKKKHTHTRTPNYYYY